MQGRLRRLAVTGLGIAGLLLTAAAPAGADVLVGVGANATSKVTGTIAEQYNIAGASVNGGDLVVNVPSQVVPPETPGIFIPQDTKYATDFTYNVATLSTAAHLPPNGAGAGKTALLNDATAGTGFIDFGRMSSQRAGSDPASLEYYAWALDAVNWVKFPGNPITNLTQQDLINVWTCDAGTHLPIYSDWSQIPGSTFSGTIVKYQAQLSSGRQKTFEQLVLNNHPIDENCDASHLSTRLFESNASGVAPATKARAIFFYGYSSYQAQTKNFTPNLRNGATFGTLNGVALTPTVINDTAQRFPGTQYLYNIADTRSPSYARVIAFLGETSGAGGTNGYICSGKASLIISAWGFVPFKNGLDPQTGHNSFCRKGAAF
jgi:phosphate transport system substrate-binding protein